MSLIIKENSSNPNNDLFNINPDELEKKIDMMVEIASDLKHAQRKAYRLQSDVNGFIGQSFPDLKKKYSDQMEITIKAHNRLYERLQKLAKSL